MNVSKIHFNFEMNLSISKPKKIPETTFNFPKKKFRGEPQRQLNPGLNYSMRIDRPVANPFTADIKSNRNNRVFPRPTAAHVQFFHPTESKTNHLVHSLNSSRIVSPTLTDFPKPNFYTPQKSVSPEKNLLTLQTKSFPEESLKPEVTSNILNFSFNPKFSGSKKNSENIKTSDTLNPPSPKSGQDSNVILNPFEGMRQFESNKQNCLNSSRNPSINFDIFNN